jgi:hypothetical protein
MRRLSRKHLASTAPAVTRAESADCDRRAGLSGNTAGYVRARSHALAPLADMSAGSNRTARRPETVDMQKDRANCCPAPGKNDHENVQTLSRNPRNARPPLTPQLYWIVIGAAEA